MTRWINKTWLNRMIRYFDLDHPVRCRVCGRPLRGRWAKVGVGPKCRKNANDARDKAIGWRKTIPESMALETGEAEENEKAGSL